jgi:cation-transporting ATPase E
MMANICGASEDENATMAALKKQFPAARDYHAVSVIPFSSARKYSGVTFDRQGTWILGAADFIFPHSHDDLRRQAAAFARDGRRVILLAHSGAPADGNALPPGLEPMAFIHIADRIRKDAKDTLQYFYKYDVDVKIISGDHPETVAHIARDAGVRGADECVDASALETPAQLREAVSRYSVFGRVSPAQKKEMVACMKEAGHKVAMMGDGVNDVLALKEADCGVAVAAGSDAAKNVSDIVLMDSSLGHLLHVVEDGRKIINNIQRVATLFITKTVYSVLLAFATLFLFESAYPFTPIQLTYISFVTIGAPSFFLALEPQYDRLHGHFILNVLRKSLPGGLCIMLGIIIVNLLASAYGYTPQELTTMCLFTATAGSMWVLLKVSRPMTRIRKAVPIGMVGLIVLGTAFFHRFFSIYLIQTAQIVILAALCGSMPFVMQLMEWLIDKANGLIEKKASRGKRAFEEKINSMHQRKR